MQIPATIRDIKSPFNYTTIWIFLRDKGAELYGEKFQLREKDADVIIRLITWFIIDKQQAKISEINLDKGILLVGPVGAVKTALMALCRFFARSRSSAQHKILPRRFIRVHERRA
jgi:predicted ATPase